MADSSDTLVYSVNCISAETTTPVVYYISPPDSGHSMGNIAPDVSQDFAVACNAEGGTSFLGGSVRMRTFNTSVFTGTRAMTLNPHSPIMSAAPSIRTGWILIEESLKYYCNITPVNRAGSESDPEAPGTTTGTEVDVIPTVFLLYQNALNPFNPATKIRFDIPLRAHAALFIYDVIGKLVRRILNKEMTAGHTAVYWDGGGTRPA